MIAVNIKDNYFDYVKEHPDCKIVVYGAGNEARKNYRYIGHIDYFCDQRAKNIELIDDIPCLLPEELAGIRGKIIIMICIRQTAVTEQICSVLDQLQLDAVVFHFFDNPAFGRFDVSPYTYVVNPKDKLRIRIVNRQDGWILSKFAVKLQEGLTGLGQEADIADEEDPMADVNHYVDYEILRKIHGRDFVRTTMVTHIDSLLLRDLVQYQAQNNVVGICMSSDTLNKLAMWGISREKLCYVNPAQDGDMTPKKTVLGITNRCYHESDLRKRDDLILQVCKQLEPRFFKLKIMGAGWDETVIQLREMGFEVDCYVDFDREIYKKMMPSLDYWIFSGFDEGGMGYLDALAAGVKTIATPQGFHLDTNCGLTYPCSTIEDFVKTLRQIQDEKCEIIKAVRDWTWENYARKHLEIWQYLTRAKPLRELYVHQSEYMDGIFSFLICRR
ncbi:MAG: hypothetical protein K2N34_01265 [Lachnospiraceae bacterium]|nr:hypothetical protein [Lachnospiraceae bacterium]